MMPNEGVTVERVASVILAQDVHGAGFIDWGNLGAVILTWFGPSAVATAVVVAFLKRFENRQVHVQNAEIEKLRSSLRQLENRSKTRFDWLHQKRAEAAVEIYGLIIDLDVTTNRLINGLTHGPSDSEHKAPLYEGVARAGNTFRNRYAKLGLLIPEGLLKSLRDLDDLMWKKYIVANVYGKDQTATDRMTLFKASDWSEITESVKGIRAALRDALGDVAEDARNG